MFGIGETIAEPEPVFGGRLHHVWKITTSKGSFAIKVLNEKLMQKENICQAFERSEHVARSFASRGVPAITALQVNGSCLHHTNNRTLMLYPWVEGAAHKIGTVKQQCAQEMGEVLGKIHAIKLEEEDFHKQKNSFDLSKLRTLLKQAKDDKHPLASELENKASLIESSLEIAINSSALLREQQLVSHGDLDQHNVIWSDNLKPSIIDWESAGLQNPAVELFNLCLDWSGFPEISPDKEAFLACFRGYKETNAGATELAPFDIAISGEFAYFLFWLSFSLGRSFDCSSQEERDIAISEALNALRSIALLEECKDVLQTWFVFA